MLGSRPTLGSACFYLGLALAITLRAFARDVDAKPVITIGLSVDAARIQVGERAMVRSIARAATPLARHGVEARLLGAAWQSWADWNDDGGGQQITFAAPDAVGVYEVRAYAATSDAVLAYSASAFLTVDPSAPTIAAQPADAITTAGQTARFSVTANGSALSFQWRKDGADISGATAATLVLTSVRPADAGGYSVSVKNSSGATTSRTATLVVSPAALPVPVVEVWHFPGQGGKLAVPIDAARVGDVVTITSSANVTARAGWRHNILVRAPAITSAEALAPEDGSGLHETVELWNRTGWGNPHVYNNAYDPKVTGLAPVDLGNREPFVHPLAGGPASSTRTATFVLDAPGSWIIGAEVLDGAGRSVAVSPQATVTVAPPPLPAEPAEITYPYGRTDRFVGVFWNAGQAHRLWSTWRAEHQSSYPSTWDMNWKLMWQPSPYFQSQSPKGGWVVPNPVADSPWQPFWSAHEVYPIVPDAGSGSTLTHDLTSQAFAEKAAVRLMDVGVDFVAVDYTNQFLETAEDVLPAMTNLARAFASVAARSQSAQRVKLTALVPAQVDSGDWNGNGAFTAPAIAKFNAKLATVYTRFASSESSWFYLEDDNGVRKPLLLLWIGATGAGDPDGKLAAGKLAQLKIADGRSLPEVFTIRWVGALLTGNPRFTVGTSTAASSAEATATAAAGNLFAPKIWSYREHDVFGATLAPAGSANPIEFATVSVNTHFEDRFGRAWQENWPAGEYFHYETPVRNEAISLERYGEPWRRSLDAAVALKPKFLMTIWAEFGSENDEPRPEMSVTVMDNNKFGTHFGDVFKAAVHRFKYDGPTCWLDTFATGATAQWFAQTLPGAWPTFLADQSLRLQGWVTPNLATNFAAGSVKVYVDDRLDGTATIGGAWNGATRWSYDLTTTAMGPGRHVVTIVADDGEGRTFQAGVQFRGEKPRSSLTITIADLAGIDNL